VRQEGSCGLASALPVQAPASLGCPASAHIRLTGGHDVMYGRKRDKKGFSGNVKTLLVSVGSCGKRYGYLLVFRGTVQRPLSDTSSP
jgi:hypothetical protein